MSRVSKAKKAPSLPTRHSPRIAQKKAAAEAALKAEKSKTTISLDNAAAIAAALPKGAPNVKLHRLPLFRKQWQSKEAQEVAKAVVNEIVGEMIYMSVAVRAEGSCSHLRRFFEPGHTCHDPATDSPFYRPASPPPPVVSRFITVEHTSGLIEIIDASPALPRELHPIVPETPVTQPRPRQDDGAPTSVNETHDLLVGDDDERINLI